MTKQGEPDQSAAGRQAGTSAAVGHRGHHRGRRRAALWCALVVAAAGVGFVASLPYPGDLIPGLGSTGGQQKAQPVPGLDTQQPLTEAQAFTADHYFPEERGVEYDGVRARRTAARDGGDCAETLLDRTGDLLHDSGCQAYVGLAFTSADEAVASSVTIYRFADEQGAQKARQALTEPDALVFLSPGIVSAPPSAAPSPSPSTSAATGTDPAGSAPPPPGTPASSGTPGQGAATGAPKAVTVTRVDPVGHYLAVTVSRYTDHRTTVPPEDRTLEKANRALFSVVGPSFMWL